MLSITRPMVKDGPWRSLSCTPPAPTYMCLDLFFTVHIIAGKSDIRAYVQTDMTAAHDRAVKMSKLRIVSFLTLIKKEALI
jgi:hypothetical protein